MKENINKKNIPSINKYEIEFYKKINAILAEETKKE